MPTDLVTTSQQFPKLLNGQTGLGNDVSHGHRRDGVVSRNLDFDNAIGHGDVLILPYDPEASFFECPNGSQVVDSG